MNLGPKTVLPLRGKPTHGWCWQDNEVYTVFQPIVGAYAIAIYSTLTAMSFGNPSVQYSVRMLAEATHLSPTTILRALELMEFVGLLRLQKGSGSQRSTCEFVDPKKLAQSLGGIYRPKTASFMLAREAVEGLRVDIVKLKGKQQGERNGTRTSALNSAAEIGPPEDTSASSAGSEQNAGVSQAIRQRSTRGTQTGSLPIKKKEEKKGPPTPHESDVQYSQDNSNEDQSFLEKTRTLFKGVMDEFWKCLLDANGHPPSNQTRASADWDEFGFRSLHVQGAQKGEGEMRLILSAQDPEATRRGLEKYEWEWQASLRAWFGCTVWANVPRPTR